MKRVLMVAVLVVTAAGVACGQMGGRGSTREMSVEKTLERMEHQWTDAYQHKDRAALGRILADDWRGQYPWGTRTKAQSLAELKPGGDTIESITFGPMTVRVYGDTAIVMGSDDETSSVGGKSSSGYYTWTDVFVRRGGRWQAVASQMTVVEGG